MNELEVVQPVARNSSRLKNRFIYHKADNRSYAISEREGIVLEVFIKTGDVNECMKALVARYGVGKVPRKRSIEFMLMKDHVVAYVEEERRKMALAAGFTLDEWKVLGLEVLHGRMSLDEEKLEVWKTLGKVEAMKGGMSGAGNVTVTLLQANGER